MESIEIVDVAILPPSACKDAKEGGVRVSNFPVVRDALDLSMTESSFRAIAAIREDALPILRRQEVRGFARIAAFVEETGGVAVSHVLMARDAREAPLAVIRAKRRRAGAAAPRKPKAVKVGEDEEAKSPEPGSDA